MIKLILGSTLLIHFRLASLLFMYIICLLFLKFDRYYAGKFLVSSKCLLKILCEIFTCFLVCVYLLFLQKNQFMYGNCLTKLRIGGCVCLLVVSIYLALGYIYKT